MKYAIYPLFAFILIGCASQKELINSEGDNEDIITATLGEFKKTDPISILNVKIEENSMFIVVEYSGGCKEHNFELVGNNAVAKSLPPQRSIQLQHNGNEDHCRELITDTVTANIEALAMSQTQGSEIILNLDGYGKELKYTFK